MFNDLLESYNPYFRMDHLICEKTMAPILQFKSLKTGEVFEYKIPRTDIEDYNTKKSVPKSIQDMISGLQAEIRDIKIDSIIK